MRAVIHRKYRNPNRSNPQWLRARAARCPMGLGAVAPEANTVFKPYCNTAMSLCTSGPGPSATIPWRATWCVRVAERAPSSVCYAVQPYSLTWHSCSRGARASGRVKDGTHIQTCESSLHFLAVCETADRSRQARSATWRGGARQPPCASGSGCGIALERRPGLWYWGRCERRCGRRCWPRQEGVGATAAWRRTPRAMAVQAARAPWQAPRRPRGPSQRRGRAPLRQFRQFRRACPRRRDRRRRPP